MPELDSLELRIEADANKADAALDRLIVKLNGVSKALGGINTSNLKKIGTALNSTKGASGVKNAQKSVDDLNKSVKNLKTKDIEIIRTDGSLRTLSDFEKALSNFDKFIEDTGSKLKNKGLLDTPIKNMQNQLSSLEKQFPKAKDLIESYKEEIKLVQNMQKKGTSTSVIASGIKPYSIKNSQASLYRALGKSLPTSGTGAGSTEDSEKKISGFSSKLKGLKTTLSSVAKSASNVTFNNVSSGITRAKNALVGYTKNAIKSINASKGFKSIVSHVRNLGLAFMTLRTVSGVLKKSITSAMDYIEEFNYFQNAIGKIAEENKGNYKKYGYKDAQSYADSFQSRLTSLSSKMTGFDISKTGELKNSGMKSLGLDITAVTNYESKIAQMTNAVGMTGEASIASSKALTMLAGDMSSLANIDLSTVMNNFSSGLSGMSMAVKKYGIDITQASLKQTAMSLGIKKNITDMTQAEKEYLRVIVMLQQSKVSWGDLANTINQPANQFRMLKTNIQQCGMMLGRLFMPMVAKVLPWLNALAGAVKDLIKHIGDLFGAKFTDDTKMNLGDDDSAYADVADDADSAADSIDNATNKQKEFNKQLQSFDKLNNLTTNKDSSKNKKDTSSVDASGKLSDALIKAVEDYEKRWNKAFKGMSNKSDELKKKIEDLFKGAWLNNDGTDIGKAIANVLNKGIAWVNKNTNKWASGLKKIATIMGTALNGFVDNFDWPGLGTAIGNSIKGALEATQTFFTTVNWVNLGKGLAKSLNAAIKTGVIQQYFKTMASEIRAAIEAAFGLITTFDFKGLGSAIGQGINDALAIMNKVNKKTGLNGWQELGQSISKGISGIVSAIDTALDTVEWDQVGQAIGDCIASIDFTGIAWDLGNVAIKILGALAEAIKSSFSKSPVETSIITALGFIKLSTLTTSKLEKAATKILQVLGVSLEENDTAITALAGKIKGAVGSALDHIGKFTNEKFLPVAKKILEKIGSVLATATNAITALGGKIKGAIEIAFGKIQGFASDVVKPIAEKMMTKIATMVGAETVTVSGITSAIAANIGAAFKAVPLLLTTDATLLGAATAGEIAAAIFSAVIGGIASAFAGFHLGQWLGGLLMSDEQKKYSYHLKLSDVFKWDKGDWSDFWQAFADWWVDVEDWWAKKTLKIKTTIDATKEKIAGWWKNVKAWWGEKTFAIKSKFEATKEKIVGWWKNVKAWWGDKKLSIKSKFEATKEKIAGWWRNVKEWWGEKKLAIKSKFESTKQKVAGWWKNVKDWWGEKSLKIKPTLVTDAIKTALNAMIKLINTKIIDSLNKISIKLPKALGGKKIGFNIEHIAEFAKGGMPNMGQLFVARERGPELVGSMRGRTAVANNDQIVDSVSQGVSDAVYNVMTPVLTNLVVAINTMNSNKNGNALYVQGVSDGDLVRIVKDANNMHKRTHNGNPLFA